MATLTAFPTFLVMPRCVKIAQFHEPLTPRGSSKKTGLKQIWFGQVWENRLKVMSSRRFQQWSLFTRTQGERTWDMDPPVTPVPVYIFIFYSFITFCHRLVFLCTASHTKLMCVSQDKVGKFAHLILYLHMVCLSPPISSYKMRVPKNLGLGPQHQNLTSCPPNTSQPLLITSRPYEAPPR